MQADTHHPLQSWVSEYQTAQQQFTDLPWAQQYLSETDNAWASEFAEQKNQQNKADKLTPEELKRLKGPQADDPLDDKTALSWVRQFNETADQPSVNSQRGACLSHTSGFVCRIDASAVLLERMVQRSRV